MLWEGEACVKNPLLHVDSRSGATPRAPRDSLIQDCCFDGAQPNAPTQQPNSSACHSPPSAGRLTTASGMLGAPCRTPSPEPCTRSKRSDVVPAPCAIVGQPRAAVNQMAASSSCIVPACSL